MIASLVAAQVTVRVTWLTLVFALLIPYCIAGLWWGGTNVGDGPDYDTKQNVAGLTAVFGLLGFVACWIGIGATFTGWS